MAMPGGMPMVVMSKSIGLYNGRRLLFTDTGPERQSGRKAQTANIVAAKVCRLCYSAAAMLTYPRPLRMLSEHVWVLKRC